jgi:hypothetical protein
MYYYENINRIIFIQFTGHRILQQLAYNTIVMYRVRRCGYFNFSHHLNCAPERQFIAEHRSPGPPYNNMIYILCIIVLFTIERA